jgi:hypothetical protein
VFSKLNQEKKERIEIDLFQCFPCIKRCFIDSVSACDNLFGQDGRLGGSLSGLT